ncbi:Cytochrome P450 4V2 [Eumeta japonica]|uniref:Cytochrome P450 4V2 n=1 Tax=Eumeta variegata TaxID=151549 RepID=A0A4C1WTS4_EUMVA|nr:Cytochrome P450 4V2 [Eumeta japonica]
MFNANFEASVGRPFRAFLDLMLELTSKEGMFTDQEIREEVDTIIVAGQDTSGATVLFNLLLLGTHQEKQQKVYDEIQEIFENSDRDVSKEDLKRLIYLDATLKESMRLYPVVCVVARQADRDIKLRPRLRAPRPQWSFSRSGSKTSMDETNFMSNVHVISTLVIVGNFPIEVVGRHVYLRQSTRLEDYTLPAGSSCVVSMWGLHRHERWGPDYDSFRPERWLDAGALPAHPAAFAAFAHGKRGCIGKNYALMSMKTMIVHILRRYRVFSDITELKLKFGTLLKPVSGHLLKIEKR